MGSTKTYCYEDIMNYINGENGKGSVLLTTKQEFEEAKIKMNTSSSKTRIKVLYSCGHEIDTTYYKFKENKGKICRECSKSSIAKLNRKTNEQFVREVYNKVGDEYLFLEHYIDSRTPILVRHNTCGHEYSVSPNHFLGDRRCPKCMRPNYNRDTEQFKKEVYTLVGNDYTVLGEYDGCDTHILMRHETCEHKWNVTPSNFLGNEHKLGTRCPKCAGYMKKTTSQFKEQVFNMHGDEYTILGEYVNDDTKISIRHNSNECNNYTWNIEPSNLIQGAKCPKCANNIKRTQEEFKEIVNNLVGEEYEVIGEYITSLTPILMRHHKNNDVHDFYIRPAEFIHKGKRCTVCNNHRGESIIHTWLRKNNINFKAQGIFKELTGIGGGLLKFDFFIYDNNDNLLFVCEYDGEGHFYPVKFNGIDDIRANQSFERIVCNDALKNAYCEDNNIPLLRIPFWEFNNIEQILNDYLNKLINLNNAS